MDPTSSTGVRRFSLVPLLPSPGGATRGLLSGPLHLGWGWAARAHGALRGGGTGHMAKQAYRCLIDPSNRINGADQQELQITDNPQRDSAAASCEGGGGGGGWGRAAVAADLR